MPEANSRVGGDHLQGKTIPCGIDHALDFRLRTVLLWPERRQLGLDGNIHFEFEQDMHGVAAMPGIEPKQLVTNGYGLMVNQHEKIIPMQSKTVLFKEILA